MTLVAEPNVWGSNGSKYGRRTKVKKVSKAKFTRKYKRNEPPRLPGYDEEIHDLLRAIKGQKAEDVAKEANISASTIRNWRSGRTRYPRFNSFKKVARTLKARYVLVDEDFILPKEATKWQSRGEKK